MLDIVSKNLKILVKNIWKLFKKERKQTLASFQNLIDYETLKYFKMYTNSFESKRFIVKKLRSLITLIISKK